MSRPIRKGDVVIFRSSVTDADLRRYVACEDRRARLRAESSFEVRHHTPADNRINVFAPRIGYAHLPATMFEHAYISPDDIVEDNGALASLDVYLRELATSGDVIMEELDEPEQCVQTFKVGDIVIAREGLTYKDLAKRGCHDANFSTMLSRREGSAVRRVESISDRSSVYFPQAVRVESYEFPASYFVYKNPPSAVASALIAPRPVKGRRIIESI